MIFKSRGIAKSLILIALIVVAYGAAIGVNAQQTSTTTTKTENLEATKAKAAGLINQQKFTEALPLLEKVVILDPDDARMHFYLGFALLGQAKNTNDSAAAQPLVIRARTAFIKAKQLGINEPVVDALIQSLPPNGDAAAVNSGFSTNKEADKLMQQGEALFSQGKLDEAIKVYQKALTLDPKIYEAALFTGDSYVQKNDFANGETWYQKAIEINPNRETAYRYSATPLMKQGKITEARERYIDAYISEPYSRFAQTGLTQWAQAARTRIGHPTIEIPVEVREDGRDNFATKIFPQTLAGAPKNDGSTAWLMYAGTRAAWRKDKFAKTFPGEKTYRHTLAEEVEALKTVLTAVEADVKNSKIKTLNPSLMTLKKLNDAGLLEAYVLLAQPDDGIVEDFPAYLKQNRPKLRQYVAQYVISNR